MPNVPEEKITVDCRCGKKHVLYNRDNEPNHHEFELAHWHQCFHDKGIVPWMSNGTAGLCADCGMEFDFTGIGYPPHGISYNLCPVCYWPSTKELESHRVCECCGTEFGNDDIDQTNHQLRMKWLSGEPRPEFFMKDNEPENWNPWLQMAMSLRHESATSVKYVSAEEMKRLWETNNMDEKLKSCDTKSVSFPHSETARKE